MWAHSHCHSEASLTARVWHTHYYISTLTDSWCKWCFLLSFSCLCCGCIFDAIHKSNCPHLLMSACSFQLSQWLMWFIVLSHCGIHFCSIDRRGSLWDKHFNFTNKCLLLQFLSVPGGIAPESLTFTPLDDMVFLKWEEPIKPNGLITQYEVSPEWEETLWNLYLFYSLRQVGHLEPGIILLVKHRYA